MLPGKVVKEFEINGEKFVFRYPLLKDYPQVQKHLSELIKEKALIGGTQKTTRKQEKETMQCIIKRIKNRTQVYLLVESNKNILGEANVAKKSGVKSHVGEIGIAIHKSIRRQGIGTRLMEAVIQEAKKNLKIEIVELEGFSQNKAAIGLYKKLGFKVVGVVKRGLKREGKYFDRILMVKYLL